MNNASRTLSAPSLAVRIVAAFALLMLPLGPFSWGQAHAATSVQRTASELIRLEVNHPTYVALGQTLDISVSVTLPEESTPGASEPQQPAEPSAPSVPTSYTATLTYKDYLDPEVNHPLGDPLYLTLGSSASFSTPVTESWAQQGRTELTVSVVSSDKTVADTKSFYLYVQPADRVVNLELCVPADDADQPAPLEQSQLKVAYGRAYSYDPEHPSTPRSLPAPTRPNYSFEGWYTGYNAETGSYSGPVTDSSIFMGTTASNSLYAKWKGETKTVQLFGMSRDNKNQGTLSASSISVTYGETFAPLASVTGTGTTGDNVELWGFTTLDGTPVESTTRVDSTLHDWRSGALPLFAVWGPKRISLESAQVSGLEEAYPYTGQPIVPEVVVTMPEHKDASGATVAAKTLVKDVDYRLVCSSNVDITAAGASATLVVEGINLYVGSVSKTFRIVTGVPYLELEGVKIASTNPPISLNTYFTGSGAATVTTRLVTDADDVSYKIAAANEEDAELVANNVSYDPSTGKLSAKVPVSIKISASCGAGTNYTATPEEGVSYILNVKGCNLADCKVKLSATKLAYNGKAQKPGVTVSTAAGTVLQEGTDYTLKYSSGCKKVGTYKVTITGKGGCVGTVSKSFKIIPRTPASLKAKAGAAYGKNYRVYKVSWGKVAGATGYQLRRTVTKTATSTVAANVTSLSIAWQKGKTVTVKVRAYKKVGTTKYYSAWRTITVKVK
ncbi:MAG: hypothetical protein ACI36Y_03975 [Coriobacteriales bacterium]